MERQTPNSNMAPPYYGQSNGQPNGNVNPYPNNTTNYQAPYQTPYQTSYQGPYQNYYPNNNQNNYYTNSTNSNNTYPNTPNTTPPYANTTYPNNSYNNNAYSNAPYNTNPYANSPYGNYPNASNPYNNSTAYTNPPYANTSYQRPLNQENAYTSANPISNQVQTNYTYQQPKEVPPIDIASKREEPIHTIPSPAREKDVTQITSEEEVVPKPPIEEVSNKLSKEVPMEDSSIIPSTESSTEVVQDLEPLTKEKILSEPIPELKASDSLSKDDEAIVMQLQDTFGDELTSEVTQALRETSENTATTVSQQSPTSVPTQSAPFVSPSITTSFVEQEFHATPLSQREPTFTPPQHEPSFFKETALPNQINIPLDAARTQSTTTDSHPAESEKVMSVGAWFGTLLLLLIPGVNIILMIVWACGCGNKNRCNMMRASLLLGILLSIIVTVLLLVFRDNLRAMFQSIGDWVSFLALSL